MHSFKAKIPKISAPSLWPLAILVAFGHLFVFPPPISNPSSKLNSWLWPWAVPINITYSTVTNCGNELRLEKASSKRDLVCWHWDISHSLSEEVVRIRICRFIILRCLVMFCRHVIVMTLKKVIVKSGLVLIRFYVNAEVCVVLTSYYHHFLSCVLNHFVTCELYCLVLRND